MANTSAEKVKGEVQQVYGQIASRVAGRQDSGVKVGCCGPARGGKAADNGLAAQLYSKGELAGLPEGVTEASLGCGNPTAIAGLKTGDVVLDLGSGGGIDCFLAANKVGPGGRVIGLDTVPEMVKLARRNARELGAANVEFLHGEMEAILLPDESVTAVISNCVVNLSPDKDAVFAEMFRVLKPGGLALYGPSPPGVAISGAGRVGSRGEIVCSARDYCPGVTKVQSFPVQSFSSAARLSFRRMCSISLMRG